MNAEGNPDGGSDSQPAGAKIAKKVEDIQRGNLDSTGNEILKVYARRVPDYAVYQTPDRAAIQYADADSKVDASEQRKWMAPINILRSQIDALVDGWRKSSKDKAKGYDTRVAAALILCLEQDIASAQSSLMDIKNDILAERNSWGRLQYLLSASLVATAIAAFLSFAWAVSVDFACLSNVSTNHPLLFPIGTNLEFVAFGAIFGFVGGIFGYSLVFKEPSSWSWSQRNGLIIASIVTTVVVTLLGLGTWVIASCPSGTAASIPELSLATSIWIGGIGGVGGAFFSIALGTMQRTLATSLNPRDNLADAALRVIVGLIGSWILVLMLRTKLLPDFAIAGNVPSSKGFPIETTLLIGFVAGFLERLVPDLLERKPEDKVKQAEEKVKQAEEKAKQAIDQAKQAQSPENAIQLEATRILGAAKEYVKSKKLELDDGAEKRVRQIAATAAADILKEPAAKQMARLDEANAAIRKLIDKLIEGGAPQSGTVSEEAINKAISAMAGWPFKA